MAIVAAFADIDGATGQFERRVGPHAFNLLDRRAEVEERGDLDQTPDRHHEHDPEHQDDRVGLEDLVTRPERRLGSLR